MNTTPSIALARPCKELVRAWLFERHLNRKPLPDLDEIRRALGWGASPEEKNLRDRSECR